MRTTLTLEDDIVAKLQNQMRKSGKSFKQVVNEVIRLGLTKTEQMAQSDLAPFVVKARKLKPKEGVNYDNIAELLERGESAEFK